MTDFTIEVLARDLLFLLTYLHWTEFTICGFSIGGMLHADFWWPQSCGVPLGIVAQQLLFLPRHPARPIPLPFQVTHVLLAGSLCALFHDERYGLPLPPRQITTHRIGELDLAHLSLEPTFDPTRVADPLNSKRKERWIIGQSGRFGLQTEVVQRYPFR
jgi:hypothetical protein